MAWGLQLWRRSRGQVGQRADGWNMGSERGRKEKQCLLQVFGSCERMTYGCIESGLGGKGRPALNPSPRQTPGLTSDSRAPFWPLRAQEDSRRLVPSCSLGSRLNSAVCVGEEAQLLLSSMLGPGCSASWVSAEPARVGVPPPH